MGESFEGLTRSVYQTAVKEEGITLQVTDREITILRIKIIIL